MILALWGIFTLVIGTIIVIYHIQIWKFIVKIFMIIYHNITKYIKRKILYVNEYKIIDESYIEKTKEIKRLKYENNKLSNKDFYKPILFDNEESLWSEYKTFMKKRYFNSYTFNKTFINYEKCQICGKKSKKPDISKSSTIDSLIGINTNSYGYCCEEHFLEDFNNDKIIWWRDSSMED